MNKEIITINNLTLVEDEKGNERQVDNCNNLYEILQQENIIEELENNKEELMTKINEQQKDLKTMISNYRFFKKITAISCVVFPLFVCLILDKVGLSSLLLTNIGNLPASVFLSGASSFVCGSIFGSVLFGWKSDIKIDENKLKGYEKQHEFITSEISKQKEQLEKLHNEKEFIKNNEDNNLKITKIKYKDEICNLERYMDLYYNLGCNYDEFLKYYNDGVLREKMGKRYTYEEKMLIENYFKESNEKEKVKTITLK